MSEQPSKGLLALPAIIKLAEYYDLTASAFALTFKAVAMPNQHTDTEFVSCCLVAREHGLNPLTKEIYFMRTKSGIIQAIVSVDGWIKKCNEHPQFDGIELIPTLDDKGKPVSMTISIFRKDRSRPTTITEFYDECAQAGGPIWKTNPHRMLRNRAITQGARLAFGFAGIMEQDEFRQWQGMQDVTPSGTEIPDVPDVSDASEATPEEKIEAFLSDLERLLERGGSVDAIVESVSRDIQRLPDDDRTRATEMISAAREREGAELHDYAHDQH